MCAGGSGGGGGWSYRRQRNACMELGCVPAIRVGVGVEGVTKRGMPSCVHMSCCTGVCNVCVRGRCI